MNRVRSIAAVIIVSSLTPGMSAAWAADAEDQPKAAPAAAQDDAGPPAQPTEVLKTKTRSNQSNDRQASPPPPKETPAANEQAEVLKTKTKSNQSND